MRLAHQRIVGVYSHHTDWIVLRHHGVIVAQNGKFSDLITPGLGVIRNRIVSHEYAPVPGIVSLARIVVG
jgi:hypothetical protein